jgi:arylsulfatase A-like enzyme
MPEQPNVLFVLTDQQRADAMGCAGNPEIRTPHMDRLAATGVRLPNTVTNSPSCTPSRACLVSGQHPPTTGVVANDLPLPTSTPSFGAAFGEAGYRTGYVGKWHLDGVPRDKFTPPGPRRQGFDDFWAVYNCAHDYFNTKYYRDSPELIEREGYEPAVQTDLAREFLAADDDSPFCLVLSWGPPHDPYELVPDRFRELYDPSELTMPATAAPLRPELSTTRGPPIRHWGTAEAFETGEPYDYDDPREVLADYYAAVTALDEQLGRLLETLDEQGLRENTIVVFTSDHGDNMWAHGHNQKGQPYDDSVRVPFLISWPEELPAGTVRETLLSTVDMGPTLLDLADVPVPDAMEGEALGDAIRGTGSRERDSVFVMSGDWRAVRTQRYTYARFADGLEGHEHIPEGHWLRFDNEQDPHQRHNLIYDREYADERDRLAADLDRWQEELGDPGTPIEDLVGTLGVEEELQAATEWFHETHEGY